MARKIAFAGILGILWILLSGHYSPLFVGLGVASVALVTLMVHRMNRADGTRYELRLRWLACGRYVVWLFAQIVRANVEVARLALRPRIDLSPRMVRVKALPRTELGRVIYGNSITLTPGTVTVHLDDEEVEVHALTRESAAALEGGAMGRRVAELER